MDITLNVVLVAFAVISYREPVANLKALLQACVI